MRNAATAKARHKRDVLLLIQLFTATLATAILIFAFAQRAQAQTFGCGEPRDGLITKAEAGTGSLLLKTETPGRYLPAPRVGTDIAVDVSGPIARTIVTQRFENPSEGWVEGVYVFPLPESAAVDTLKMKIGERFIEGQIKERQEARRIYEAAKANGQKASLVEEERPNLFTNSVANIGPHEAVTVRIEYQESLRFDQGRFHLRIPLVVGPRYSPGPVATLVRCAAAGIGIHLDDPVPDRERLEAPVLRPEGGPKSQIINPVTLTVHLEAGFPLGVIESASHAIAVEKNGKTGATIALKDADVPADRDFTLSFAPAPGAQPDVALLKEQGSDGDYLLALIMPPAQDASLPAKPREAIFVLDNSGSMGGESIREAKAGLLAALDRLTPADRFNVIRFDDTLTVLFPDTVDATPENIAFAKGFVSHIEANGGTEMLPALLAALKDETPTDETHLRQVIFLTDGAVGNEAQLFGAIGEKLGRSRLFTVGIGSAPNSYFMAGAARAGRGSYTYIGATDQVTAKMTELFAKLERPVMTNLSARLPDGMKAEFWPDPLPDLYAGEPVLLTLKTPKADGTLMLAGSFGGKPWQIGLDLAKAEPAAGVAKLWARNKIAALEESRVRGADFSSVEKGVLETALAYHLTSRLTSLVAVDVTPSRPADAALSSGKIPLNLPAGWDFDKVFGETLPPLERRADAYPADLVTKLASRAAPSAAVKPGEQGLVLPQGGTDARAMLIAGALLLLAGAGLFLRLRRNAQ
jgi:Ca-activated chloride channel homolog